MCLYSMVDDDDYNKLMVMCVCVCRNTKNIQKLNQRVLELGIVGKKSWHDEYKDSAWVFIGGLPYDLSEGDIVCVFSQ